MLIRNKQTLSAAIEQTLEGLEEAPALLHGDLWSGNYLESADHEPVLIDPAVYYGHREAEFSIMKLFGGFPAIFYETYQKKFPFLEGYEIRLSVYIPSIIYSIRP